MTDHSKLRRRRRVQQHVLTMMSGVGFALAAAVAGAQDLDFTTLHELDDDRTDITYEGLTVDDLEDLNVYRDGQKIGDIEAVLGDGNDEVVALVLDYDGRLAGVGDPDVVVPIDEFEFTPGRREAVITLSDADLAQLQVWDD